MNIYGRVNGIWVTMCITAVCNALNLFATTVLQQGILIVISLIAAIAYVCCLSAMRNVSWRFDRAYSHQILSIILLVIAMLSRFFLVFLGSLGVLVFSLLVLAAGIAGLLSNFQLFWGLDDLIITNGYGYPNRKIRWCFYAPLIAGVLSVIPGMNGLGGALTGLIISALGLVLFFQYNRAVKDAESGY